MTTKRFLGIDLPTVVLPAAPTLVGVPPRFGKLAATATVTLRPDDPAAAASWLDEAGTYAGIAPGTYTAWSPTERTLTLDDLRRTEAELMGTYRATLERDFYRSQSALFAALSRELFGETRVVPPPPPPPYVAEDVRRARGRDWRKWARKLRARAEALSREERVPR